VKYLFLMLSCAVAFSAKKPAPSIAFANDPRRNEGRARPLIILRSDASLFDFDQPLAGAPIFKRPPCFLKCLTDMRPVVLFD
jgi:hypothetical protein